MGVNSQSGGKCMKILIAYAGKTGTTEKCARLLAEKLPDAAAVDLNLQTPQVASFDTVVVGGSIRMGQLHSKVKNFLVQNTQSLKSKKTAYFICCGSAENASAFFANNFPKELLERACGCECFGGEMKIENMHGVTRLMTKMILKSSAEKNVPPPQIIYENIGKLAEEIIR